VSLARALWHDNADLAAAALAHPFVRGITNGTLPRDLFAGYIAQDAFFLESFARGYALAIAHSPDRAGMDAFANLLGGVREELNLHATYAAKWGIDLSTVTPTPATAAYTDFLLATAALGGVGLTCAAMTPCMRLYAYLGQQLAGAPVRNEYAEWVHTYADPAFQALATRLEELLDTYTMSNEPPHHKARATYRRALWLELHFFDAAWNATPTGHA
jgi:thiaminase/transcriptional activator TenA